MYEKLEQVCKCGAKMLEVLAYDEAAKEGNPRAFRKGWHCPSCNGWEPAILRERLLEEN